MKEIMPSYLFELLNLVVNKLDVEVKWLLALIFDEIFLYIEISIYLDLYQLFSI